MISTAPVIHHDPAWHAAQICEAWQSSVVAIIETGRLISEAKAQLEHGDFISMVERQLPFNIRTAQRLMAIANDPRLSDATHASHLPPSWMSLYEITRLDDEQFEHGIEAGVICSEAQRSAIVQLRRPDPSEAPPLPPGKYQVIYADPPWQYSNSGAIGDNDNYGRAARHYPCMSLDELCALGVQDLAADRAVLFMWSTAPMLRDAMQVLEAWGFSYKAQFVWDKVRHNFGHYNSVRHELLLICTRGSCTPENPQQIDSVVVEERAQRHSEKPETFRQIIEDLYPSAKKVELFARQVADGWACWGNDEALKLSA